MDFDLDHLAAAVLQLPTADRATLAARLLASLDAEEDAVPSAAEWDGAWAAEAARRDAELDANPALAVPADEAFRRAQAIVDAAAARGAGAAR